MSAADMLCRFIDAEGKVLDLPINDRVVAIEPATPSLARKVVLASNGLSKHGVIRGAMKLLRPQVRITDELVAERLAAD